MNTAMTEPEDATAAELQDATEPEGATESEDTENTGINQEHAEELAAADYQSRLEEFDNVDTTPVVSVPAPGEPGVVQMPKPE
jgi:hypothetical protein